MIQVASDLSLPIDAITQTYAILGIRGSGKTSTGVVLAEEMIKAGGHIVIADTVGVWWGLRSCRDGNGEGLPIYIFGGDHGDVPITASSGEYVADIIMAGASAVLDLSDFLQDEQSQFIADFATRLYHKNRQPVQFLVDECDAFVPQTPQRDQRRALNAMEILIRRGRARGIGITLISQRAAVINKNVLSQAEVLIALRMSEPRLRPLRDIRDGPTS